MRDDFDKNEQNIREGKAPNDETVDRYPDTFTQDQIDTAKTDKRGAKMDVAIRDMKETFNVVEEMSIPLAAKLDPQKKYWLGIDNSSATVDQDNYLSVVTAAPVVALVGATRTLNGLSNNIVKQEVPGGFISEIPNTWTNFSALWFKTFYPEHSKLGDNEILSGATISDLGKGKMIYRYHFAPNDASSQSGFSGRKLYDRSEGTYQEINASGNYTLSYDDFAVYKFNMVYPANKIIVREVNFDQSLALEISTDGENWEEIYSDNPAEDGQTIDPIVYNPKEKTAAFYLRIKPGGDSCLLSGLSVEAELEKQ